MSQTSLRNHLPGRDRGHRGGAILPHRAIWRLHWAPRRLVGGLLIALFFTAVLGFGQTAVATLWGEQMVWWMQALALPGQFALPDLTGIHLLAMPVPLIDPRLADPRPLALTGHALACISLWLAAGWLPDSAKPGAYLLRFAVLIHSASLLYFWLWPASFPHSLINHIGGGLRQTWVLLLLTPWLHLFTYYLFPFAVWQRLLLTTLTLAYLALLAPLQYTSHVALLMALGTVTMPLLHLLFGVMVPILGLVALYGWGMSWHDPARETDPAGTEGHLHAG